MTEHSNISAIALVPDNKDAGKAINGVIEMSLQQQGAWCERTSEQFNPREDAITAITQKFSCL